MKKLLFTAVFALCLSSYFFFPSIFSNSSVHANPSPLVTKQTKVAPLSASACSALRKSDSRLTQKDCAATLTSTTIRSLSSNIANGCPSGYVTHWATDTGSTWGVELDTQFQFYGNCARPSITYNQCQNNMYAYWPFSVANVGCSKFAINSSREMSEGVWNFATIAGLGNFTITVQSIASNNGSITDTGN